jgi:transposase-like protein
MIDDGQVPIIHTIQFETIAYIDRVKKEFEKDLNARCEKWNLELDGLRNEWRLEHRNLINQIDTAEKIKATDKIEVDKHFERINDLQARMDKIQTQFVTKDAVDQRIKTYLAYSFGISIAIISILGIIIGVLVGKL